MKSCASCKWSDAEKGVARCSHPSNGVSLVTGQIRSEFCAINRLFGWLICRLENSCGKAARWWEARDAV